MGAEIRETWKIQPVINNFICNQNSAKANN